MVTLSCFYCNESNGKPARNPAGKQASRKPARNPAGKQASGKPARNPARKQGSTGPSQYLTEVCHNEFSLVYRFSCFPVHHLAAPVSRLTVCNRGLGYVCREQDKGIIPPDVISPYLSKPLLLQWNLHNICTQDCLVGS